MEKEMTFTIAEAKELGAFNETAVTEEDLSTDDEPDVD